MIVILFCLFIAWIVPSKTLGNDVVEETRVLGLYGQLNIVVIILAMNQLFK